MSTVKLTPNPSSVVAVPAGFKDPKFAEDSVENYLIGNTAVDRHILKQPHKMFSMRIEEEELVFDMTPELGRYVYNENLTAHVEKSISCTNLILSEHDDSAFGTVMNSANNYSPRDYDEEYEDHEFELMCKICFSFYMSKFKDIKSIEDVTRPIPVQLFVKLLNDNLDKYEFIYKDERTGYEYAGKISNIQAGRSFFGLFIVADMKIISKNHQGYVQSVVRHRLNAIESAQKIEDLGLKIMTPEDKLRLSERGHKYVECTNKPAYRHCNGFAYRPGNMFGDPRTRIDGRVMIDIGAMRMLNPHIGDGWYTGQPFNNGEANPIVEADKYWMCSPVVFGFSLGSKEWARMNIEDVSPIQFSPNAFDELIIPEEYKDIFVACLTNDMPSLDSIEGKGAGKIFLLYGPPGVGKTLTAESVAEYLQRPLYYVSVGELGISPETMEENLSKVMEVATSWDAIVLLDEVDIFAMKRTGSDIERNAMVGILLRLLERYSGVMFMTTNLKDNLDEAFISRATASIEYKSLSTETRIVIWKGLLKKASRLGIVIDDDIHESMDKLSLHQLNGREIKNKVRLAFSVASSKSDKRLNYKTLNTVIKM